MRTSRSTSSGESHADEVEDELVHEDRVEVLRAARREIEVLDGAVLGVDVEPPGQVRGLAVELLVPPVAPAAHGLGEQEPRREAVREAGRCSAPERQTTMPPAMTPKRMPPQMPRPPSQTATGPHHSSGSWS